MFSVNSKKYKTPSILVLQSEGILIQYEKNKELPFCLTTNRVGDCACLVFISKAKGIAYMEHIYLRRVSPALYVNYIHSIVELFELNSSQTFVVLVGGHDTTANTLSELNQLLKDKCFTKAKVITECINGPETIERCVELSEERGVEVVTIDFANNDHAFSYQKISLEKDTLAKNDFAARAQVTLFHDQSKIDEKIFNSLNTISSSIVQEKINATLENRLCQIGLLENDLGKEYQERATLANFRECLNLEKTPSVNLSKPLFDCLIHRPMLFKFLKDFVGLKSMSNFDYQDVNKFRLGVIQTAIKQKELTPDEVLCMTSFAETILYDKHFMLFLQNNMPMKKIIMLTDNNLEVVEIYRKFKQLLLSEDIVPVQLSSLTFESIENIYVSPVGWENTLAFRRTLQ